MAFEVHYPQQIPLEAVKEAYRIVKGGTIDSEFKLFAEAVYNVQGYAQGQLIGDAHPPLIGSSAPLTTESACDAMEAVVTQHDPQASVVGAAAIPWGPLAAYLLQLLIDRLLKK